MNDDDNQITPRLNARSELNAIQSNVSAFPLTRLEDYFRRKNTEGRTQLVGALRGLVDEMELLNRSVVNFEKSTVSLHKLDDIRAAEERRILSELDRGDLEMVEGIEIARLKLAIEKMELQIKKDELENRLNTMRNPLPPPPQPPPKEKQKYNDPNLDKLRDIFNGGGKYTQVAKAHKEDLIKARGGEENLTTEDQESIRHGFQEAADIENSKSRR